MSIPKFIFCTISLSAKDITPEIETIKEKLYNYESVHNYLNTGDEIRPFLPLQKGGIPLFGKEGPFDTAHGHELVEW